MAINFDRSALLPFLQRYPWADYEFLEAVWGPIRLKAMIENSGDVIQKHDVKDIGTCYALADEAMQTAFGIWRFRAVRWFVLKEIGVDAINSGFSPTPSADGEFFWQGVTWRVWADIANISPEALGFIQHAPRGFGPEVRDLVLTTDRARFASLHAQINLKWPGTKEVFLWELGSKAHYVVKGSSSFGKAWKNYTKADLDTYFQTRRVMGDKRLNENKLAPFVLTFTPIDWMLIAESGNNPFMTAWELAYLVTLRLVQDDRDHRRLLDKLAVTKVEIARLIQNDLLKVVSGAGLVDRLVPSWQGMRFYSLYLGTEPDDMIRFLPWPQKKRDFNHVTYSEKWLEKLKDHQSLCREFALSLAYGARTVGNGLGFPRIDVATTIASRLVYRRENIWDDKKIEWVTPDALVFASIVRGAGAKGPATELISRTLFVEIDRATNSIEKLKPRLDRYAKVWPYLKALNPTLVWVIPTSEYREDQILKMMRARGLDGWTVLMSRLQIDIKDPDWTLAPPAFGELEYKAVNGLSPFRPIWLHTSLPEGADFVPFLFHAPWNNHNQITNLPSNILR